MRGYSILSWICGKRASLRCISAGILRSPYSCSAGVLGGARVLSTSTRISYSPWLMLSPATEGGDNSIYKFYKLAEKEEKSYVKCNCRKEGCPDNDAKVVGSTQGWLALFNRRDYKLFLLNPVTNRHIKLPAIQTLPIRDLDSTKAKKVVISCSPDTDEEECRAMMIFGPACSLAFCSPGHSNWWTPVGALYDEVTGGARVYKDVAYSSRQKLFYCVTERNHIEAWDLRDHGAPRLDWMFKDVGEDMLWPYMSDEEFLLLESCMTLKYLVFAEEDLFLVVRHVIPGVRPDGSRANPIFYAGKGWDFSYPYKTAAFHVYKIVRKGEGAEVRHLEQHLDGLVMFVGGNQSYAIPAASDEFPANSIYFTDDYRHILPEFWAPNYGGHDNGIFNYENKTFSSLPRYPCDYQSIRRIVPPPVWFTPTLES